jgi:hypothetical protein
MKFEKNEIYYCEKRIINKKRVKFVNFCLRSDFSLILKLCFKIRIQNIYSYIQKKTKN